MLQFYFHIKQCEDFEMNIHASPEHEQKTGMTMIFTVQFFKSNQKAEKYDGPVGGQSTLIQYIIIYLYNYVYENI